MTKSPVSRIYVDHHLQAAILTRLSDADGPLRFSELKEDGIDNSLFMYHANKLINRKAIVKNDDGFGLTPDGARWVNSVGLSMMTAQATVKPLIQLVIRDTAGNILLSSRKGQLKELLNDHMLPGGLHKSGATADENAIRIAKNILGDVPHSAPRFLSLTESINSYDDGFIYHSLSHIYAIDVESANVMIDDDRFELTWLPLADVNTDNPLFTKSQFVTTFLEKLETGMLLPREVIRTDYTE